MMLMDTLTSGGIVAPCRHRSHDEDDDKVDATMMMTFVNDADASHSGGRGGGRDDAKGASAAPPPPPPSMTNDDDDDARIEGALPIALRHRMLPRRASHGHCIGAFPWRVNNDDHDDCYHRKGRK